MVRIFAILLGLALTVTAFQNCGGDVPSGVPKDQSASQADLQSIYQQNSPPLLASLTPAAIGVNQSASVDAQGGVPPYQVRILSGSALMLNSITVTGTSAGDVLLEVVDSVGERTFLTLPVAAAPPPPPPPPPSSLTFNVANATACVNGYCSCFTATAGVLGTTTYTATKGDADAFCVLKGYKVAIAYSTMNGVLNTQQCRKADGTNCIATRLTTQYVCKSITCSM